jgi:hypothetical protein
MKNFLVSIALVFVFLASSCATLGNNPGFVAFGACTTQGLEASGKTLLNDIQGAFATGNYEAEAVKLIAQFGYAEVQCGIDLYIAEASAKKSLAPNEDTALQNMRAYRAAHPVKG